MRKIDLTGQRFGKLEVIKEIEKCLPGKIKWLCQCDCGNTTTVFSNNLSGDHTTSCGCAKSGSNTRDISGLKFGKLTAISVSKKSRSGKVIWKCLCDCGKEVHTASSNLVTGNTTSCGCSRLWSKTIDISGRSFDRLTALEIVGKNRFGMVLWRCSCSCGNETIAPAHSIVSGHTSSCGCLHAENMKTHGLSYTKEYRRALCQKRRELERNLDCEWTVEMEIAITKFQPVCVVCGDDKAMATDHVDALSRGFGLRPGNAVRLCRSCNSTKLARTLNNLKPAMREKIATAAQQFLDHWQSLQ